MIDFAKFREIADEVGALLYGGHRAHRGAGRRQGASVSISARARRHHDDAQNVARAARRDSILTNDDELAKAINRSVFPGSQGGPLMHIIAAKAVAFGEALRRISRRTPGRS